jgi:uncharacterized C2H2 Zn-finger protein
MSIEAHQCPRCELRFATQWELEAHLAEAHPDFEVEKPYDA